MSLRSWPSVATLVLVLSSPCLSWAGAPVGAAGGISLLFQAAETVVPDARYELCYRGCDDSTHRAILSWPASIFFNTFDVGSKGAAVVNRPFVEPQLRLGKNSFRMVVGDRATYWLNKRKRAWVPWYENIGFSLEAGGVFSSEDGNGGFVGGGLSFGGLDQSWFLTSVTLEYRHTWTDKEHRQDLTLDLVVAVDLFK